MILSVQFPLEVLCYECGENLEMTKGSSKWTGTKDVQTIYAKPCKGCLDKRLNKIKESL